MRVAVRVIVSLINLSAINRAQIVLWTATCQPPAADSEVRGKRIIWGWRVRKESSGCYIRLLQRLQDGHRRRQRLLYLPHLFGADRK